MGSCSCPLCGTRAVLDLCIFCILLSSVKHICRSHSSFLIPCFSKYICKQKIEELMKMPSSISINLSFVTVNNWNEEQRGNHEALTCLKTSDNLKPHPHII